jgi:hypothetical protein
MDRKLQELENQLSEAAYVAKHGDSQKVLSLVLRAIIRGYNGKATNEQISQNLNTALTAILNLAKVSGRASIDDSFALDFVAMEYIHDRIDLQYWKERSEQGSSEPKPKLQEVGKLAENAIHFLQLCDLNDEKQFERERRRIRDKFNENKIELINQNLSFGNNDAIERMVATAICSLFSEAGVAISNDELQRWVVSPQLHELILDEDLLEKKSG